MFGRATIRLGIGPHSSFTFIPCLVYAFIYLLYRLLVFGFSLYVCHYGYSCLLYFILWTLVLIVIYRDFLCYLVYRPQGYNKLELKFSLPG